MRWWRFAKTTGVWGALSRGFGGQEFLGFHLKTSKDMAVNLDKGKLISAHMYLLLSPSSHLARHICLPVLASLPSLSALPQGAALWTQLAGSACCLLRGRWCQLLQLRELPHRAPCSGRDVPCLRGEWKRDSHLPQDPVRLVTHSLFPGSHTIPLAKITLQEPSQHLSVLNCMWTIWGTVRG